MASSAPALAAAVLLLAALSAQFPSKSAADGSTPGECPYPCLPPPTSAANCPPPPSPPPPPTEPSLPCPPPPPQPYTPGYNLPPPPPPWGPGGVPYYPPPRYDHPAPPPPNPIMPYFPYYYRSHSTPLLGCCCWLGLAVAVALLHLILPGF